MSEYETDSDAGDVTESFRNSFASLSKVKSNTPRARFDVHFYPESIQLIQFTLKHEVSNRHRIHRDDVIEIFRLPHSNDKQTFLVLHLRRPIVGGNKATTEYNFVVFNFTQEDYEEVTLHLDNPIVRDMFDDDIVESESIEGRTAEVFETILTQIFAKNAITPAINYDGDNAAKALRCTFWDNDDHFLYPLDDGFVNVWKYCQRLTLRDVKNVRFIRSQGRSKTFDFYIYPVMKRAIRRYHIGAGKSNTIDCFFLEFKAIDLDHYDGLFEYCCRHKITISTNDFRNDTDDSSSESHTETNASESGSSSAELIDDGFEAPDPYMAHLQVGQRSSTSHSGTSSTGGESASTSDDEVLAKKRATTPPEVTRSNAQKRRFRRISRNVITDETESSSNDSVATGSRKRRSLRIDSDDDVERHNETVTKKNSLIDDSESD
ncbi:hypothetical protein HA402_004278 [Bradysia odoriphaga]|nr:hypothetical protein HA402_004278 [Bradysia odoriphaga]